MQVTVCICTLRRPELLGRLLERLIRQETGGSFGYSIVVVDNDRGLSARGIVADFAARSAIAIEYCSEPRQNIALARNRAVARARGEWVALIDDDELPECDWLRRLVEAARCHRTAGVLGPVRPHFDAPPPRWLVEGRFCERPEYPTGTVMHWSRCFAGNALLRRTMLAGVAQPFRPECGLGGEDVDFFRRMSHLGHTFVWCNEAVVHEVVPASRWRRRYWFKRALLHGSNSLKQADATAIAKSFVAVPVYAIVLPGTFLLPQHGGMKIAMKLTGHLGRLFAFVGLTPIRQRPS